MSRCVKCKFCLNSVHSDPCHEYVTGSAPVCKNFEPEEEPDDCQDGEPMYYGDQELKPQADFFDQADSEYERRSGK